MKYIESIEKSILSSIFFDPSTLSSIDLTAKDFIFPFHQKLFQTFLDLEKKEYPIEETTVQKYMEKSNNFDEVAFLDILASNPISNSDFYVNQIKEHSQSLKYKNTVNRILADESLTLSERTAKINRLGETASKNVDSLPVPSNTKEIQAEKPFFFLRDKLPIQKNEVTMITGKGGGGKSFVAIWLLAMLKNEGLKVFGYLSEDSIGNTKNRLETLRKTTATLQDFDIWGKNQRPEAFIQKSRDGNLQPSAYWYKFTNHFDKYDVILLDPLIAFIAEDENSNTEARFLFNLFNEWCVKKNKTIVVIHHHNKNDETRGASAFVDAVRLHYSISKKENNDTSRFLNMVKTNHFAGKSEFEIKLFSESFEEQSNEEVIGLDAYKDPKSEKYNPALDITIIEDEFEEEFDSLENGGFSFE